MCLRANITAFLLNFFSKVLWQFTSIGYAKHYCINGRTFEFHIGTSKNIRYILNTIYSFAHMNMEQNTTSQSIFLKCFLDNVYYEIDANICRSKTMRITWDVKRKSESISKPNFLSESKTSKIVTNTYIHKMFHWNRKIKFWLDKIYI